MHEHDRMVELTKQVTEVSIELKEWRRGIEHRLDSQARDIETIKTTVDELNGTVKAVKKFGYTLATVILGGNGSAIAWFVNQGGAG